MGAARAHGIWDGVIPVSQTGFVDPADAKTGDGLSSLPRTKLGKATIWLAAFFVVGFGVNTVVFMPISMAYPDASWRIWFLPAWGITLMASGVAAAITAVLAIVKGKERSWVVWAALAPGIFAILFLLGEFLIPH